MRLASAPVVALDDIPERRHRARIRQPNAEGLGSVGRPAAPLPPGWRQHHPPPNICSFQGRLLAFFPDDSLDCGVAHDETEGFFTEGNVPPWDTWVAYLQEGPTTSHILAWAPGPLARMVNDGIRVIPEQCVEWIDERRPHLIEALAARGLHIDKPRM